MKRLWVALGLAVFILAIYVTGIITLNVYKKDALSALENAQKAAEDGNFDEAEKYAKQAETIWIDAENILSIFVNHKDLSEVGLSVAKLEPLIKAKEVGAFNAECRRSIVALIHIYKSEMFSWDNFL